MRGVFTKYCNKWYLDKEVGVAAKNQSMEGKVVLLVSMMKKTDNGFVAVLPSGKADHGFSSEEIYRRVGAYKVRKMI